MTLDSKSIHDLGNPCLQSHAPYCNAACPLHIDAKALAAAVTKGDFAQGLKILQQDVNFAGIIGCICDHPCQKQCKRAEVEEAIEISRLERACVEYAYDQLEKPVYQVNKKQKVAVVGSGLSSLTVAVIMARKGYAVTVFEAANRLGGRLNDYPEDILPRRVLDGELDLLTAAGVQIKLGVTVGKDIPVDDLLQDFAVVYLGCGQKPLGGLKTEINDPLLQTTKNPRVFVGGSYLGQDIAASPILCLASGKTAMLSMERTMQKVSIGANRKNEGAYQSQLYTSLEDVTPQAAVIPQKSVYSPDEAQKEAARCLQCRCLECMRGCTYLKEFDQYPGECIKNVVKNIIIMPGWGVRIANDFINSCSLCGLCKKVCPVDIDMGFVNREARRLMWDMDYLAPALHDLPLRDMEFANSAEAAILKHQAGHDKSRYLFFPGCQMSASLPQTLKKTYTLLCDSLSGGVGLMLQCCGAPADWSGRQDLSAAIWDDIKDKWRQMGSPTLIVACPGCQKTFKDFMPDIPTVFINDILLGLPLPQFADGKDRGVFAFHDSCTSRYDKDIQDSCRSLASRLGARIEELPYNRENTQCCGYGGLQYHINPELTVKVVQNRINENPRPFLTACTNCRDFFAKCGKQSHHLLELLFGDEKAIVGLDYSLPDYDERRDNRRALKTQLLKELWQEDNQSNQKEYKKVKLIISDDIRKKMQQQQILIDDIQEVIDFAESNNQKMLSPDTGCFVAGKRLKIITYWVEYTIEGDAYRIHNCYSHRMHVLTDTI